MSIDSKGRILSSVRCFVEFVLDIKLLVSFQDRIVLYVVLCLQRTAFIIAHRLYIITFLFGFDSIQRAAKTERKAATHYAADKTICKCALFDHATIHKVQSLKTCLHYCALFVHYCNYLYLLYTDAVDSTVRSALDIGFIT